ncbi:Serine phosphatase RsbU, regulator of sigma subunit [Proteiniborus ethanoligenes]|uniref:Serine phosphatase RsbU, regulator of sigma subunit n=1 Tax=Proteiniborus ethanoligenes TaxID=415015 RepID=A0A1H3LNS3_9FIRM|nr:MASE3 domain-containing protein [Proteiniborus ethanoligenes]SDY65628.1 Serine phosphatase RsbU, regulator of sigma subunit [Proteiniborus ethanoligenes]
MIAEKAKKSIIHEDFLLIVAIFAINLMFLRIIGVYEEQIYRVLNIPEFLTAHIVLEFLGILLFFMTYTITYYTFNKNMRLRLLVYSSTFFITGSVSFFHTMSYKGMPSFFTESSAPKATIFWMISRLVLAIGLFIAAAIPVDKKTNLKREYFLGGSIVATLAIFYIGTYKQDLLPPMFIDGQGLTPLKIYLEYFVMILFSVTVVFCIRDYIRTNNRIFKIYYISLCFAVFTDGAFTLYKSVYDTYNLLGHMFNIVFGFLVFRAIFSYNLDHPYNELDKAKKRIKRYADNLEEVVENRTAEIQAVNNKMMEDLEHAKRIQQSLLPQKSLKIFNTKFISEYIPCERLSGDFYNIHALDEEHLAMYIADVSGHGVSAAVMTVFADRIMKPTNLFHSGENIISPSEKLQSFYEEFNKSDFPNEMHIVIFEAVYNIRTQKLSYCSGGMNVLPILVRRNGDWELLDKSSGFTICKFAEFYKPKYENAYLDLNRGDRIIFYTDGLVECFKGNTLLKMDTIVTIMKEYRYKSLNRLNERILLEIRENTKDGYIHDDDITYFILEV